MVRTSVGEARTSSRRGPTAHGSRFTVKTRCKGLAGKPLEALLPGTRVTGKTGLASSSLPGAVPASTGWLRIEICWTQEMTPATGAGLSFWLQVAGQGSKALLLGKWALFSFGKKLCGLQYVRHVHRFKRTELLASQGALTEQRVTCLRSRNGLCMQGPFETRPKRDLARPADGRSPF